jgi:glutamate-1-semialdehyde 2,1-aminomutase
MNVETMSMTNLLEQAASEISALTPRTAEAFTRAKRVVPGGFTRAAFFWPTPLYLQRGYGARVVDLDGREYIDALMGFGVMILGHRHPAVTDAVQKQLERGTHFGVATAVEAELAELIVANAPGVDKVLFVNSGSEATLGAVRLALAATGRTKVAKFDGGWHGWGDSLLHSSHGARGSTPDIRPSFDTFGEGIPSSVRANLAVLPFNDPGAIQRIRDEHDELACVVVEGVQGAAGCIPADPTWAKRLREVCDECGVLLILDEVITGFRLGPAGAAGHFGITPDLTTFGKAIGGGLPIGAIGGRSELMDQVIPDASGNRVLLAGTFSANPLSLSAGKAQLEFLLADAGNYERLNDLGARVRRTVQEAADASGLAATVTGAGSLWGLHLETTQPPTSVRESAGFAHTPARPLAGYLLREGVLMQAPIHQGFLSLAHDEKDIGTIAEAHHASFEAMKQAGFFV